MGFKVFINFSKISNLTKSAFLIKNERGETLHSGIAVVYDRGIAASLFIAALDAAKKLPTDASIAFYSPSSSFFTKKHTKAGRAEKDEFWAYVAGRSIVERINADAPEIAELTTLLRGNMDGVVCDFGHVDNYSYGEQKTYDYVAYTDGSCNNLSPYGEGGAAYVVLQNGVEVKRGAKGFIHTTNNRMEMLAIISAVNSVPAGSSILVHTDSQYCITVFAPGYKIKPATKNADLIARWREVSAGRHISLSWVKGHAGNEFNELCDRLADSCTEQMRVEHNIPLYTVANSPKCSNPRA